VSKIVIPVRYAAWLNGDLGRVLERTLTVAIGDGLVKANSRCVAPKVTRLPRGFLVEVDEDAGVLLGIVEQATRTMESGVEKAYPVFHYEMGPVWTGTLQVVYEPPVTA
jgi:hypothetical protein